MFSYNNLLYTKKPNVEINYQIQASAIEFHESFNYKVFNDTSCCFLFGKNLLEIHSPKNP